MFELLTGLGLAMPAGLNAYIPLLAIALADRYTGLIQLAAPYDTVSSPWAIAVIAMLLGVEIIADKVPIVDHINDLIQSFIRPAAGGVLVMASTDAVQSINPVLAMILGLVVAGSCMLMVLGRAGSAIARRWFVPRPRDAEADLPPARLS